MGIPRLLMKLCRNVERELPAPKTKQILLRAAVLSHDYGANYDRECRNSSIPRVETESVPSIIVF